MQEPKTNITPSQGGTYTVEVTSGNTTFIMEMEVDQLNRLRKQCREAISNADPGDVVGEV